MTEKEPGPTGTMLPALGVVPSPQLIVAAKSIGVAMGLASVKVATWPVKVGAALGPVAPSVVATLTPAALSAPSATVAVPVTSRKVPSGSVMEIVTAYGPSSA